MSESPKIEVLREELTYHRGARQSYFKDIVARAGGHQGAKDRIERHGREMAVELERRASTATRPAEVEYRTNPHRTSGQGGNFAPPLWLIEEFATLPRPRRVLAETIPGFELPQGVQSVNVPRLTAGTSESATADLAADPNTDITDASAASAVVTVTGEGTVAQQLLDQSPAGAHLDWAYFKDLSEAYDGQLEAQLINGSGASGQLTGLLNQAGVGSVTFTSASPSATGMFPLLGQMVAKIGNARRLPPEKWLMTTSRLGWLGSSEDAQNRPLMIADKDGTGKFDLLTFEVDLDDAIPTSLGAGVNQDTIVLCRPSDFLLFESTPRTRVSFDNSLSGTLQVRLHLHRYAAVLWRYPTAIVAMSGTGTIVQAGF